MKNTAILLLFLISALSINSCHPTEEMEVPDSGRKDLPPDWSYFNQANSYFKQDEINCLLANWYEGTYYKEKPVVFRVINDDSTYRAFFNCKADVELRAIDFSAYTLLVGMNAGSGSGNEAPVNITQMKQVLYRKGDGYLLRVIVRGRKSSPGGGEWFGFTSLVSKIQREVKLEMEFQYE